MYPTQNVGAGLLANAACQSAYLALTHRIREQARSHNTHHRLASPKAGRTPNRLIHTAATITAPPRNSRPNGSC